MDDGLITIPMEVPVSVIQELKRNMIANFARTLHQTMQLIVEITQDDAIEVCDQIVLETCSEILSRGLGAHLVAGEASSKDDFLAYVDNVAEEAWQKFQSRIREENVDANRV